MIFSRVMNIDKFKLISSIILCIFIFTIVSPIKAIGKSKSSNIDTVPNASTNDKIPFVFNLSGMGGQIIYNTVNNTIEISAYVKVNLDGTNSDIIEPKVSVVDGDTRKDYVMEAESSSSDGTSYELILPCNSLQESFMDAVDSGRELKFILWFSGAEDESTLSDDRAVLITLPIAQNTDKQDSEILRQRIVAEAIYWNNKIPYCFDNKAKTQILDRNNPPKYMDCSGFTSSIYKTVMNIDIGSSTSVQLTRGIAIKLSDIKPGDLLVFDWPNKKGVRDGAPDHTGIYLGDNNFINETGSNTNPNKLASTMAKQNVKIYNLNTNWGTSGGIQYGLIKDNICSIRRIIQDNNSYINKPKEGELTFTQVNSK